MENINSDLIYSNVNIPVLPNGLKIMADQGFAFARPLLIPPSKNMRLPDRLRKLVIDY